MTHPPEQGQTLDEQIYLINELIGSMEPEDNLTLVAAIDSLRRLKARDEAVMPELPDTLPDCMMPDGGDCCLGHHKLCVAFDALKLHAQKSAEAARVAREDCDNWRRAAEALRINHKAYEERAETAESRLREVEARTVERCAKEADPIPIPIDDYLRIQNHVVKREVDLEWNLRTGIAARIRALPPSTDTEEK